LDIIRLDALYQKNSQRPLLSRCWGEGQWTLSSAFPIPDETLYPIDERRLPHANAKKYPGHESMATVGYVWSLDRSQPIQGHGPWNGHLLGKLYPLEKCNMPVWDILVAGAWLWNIGSWALRRWVDHLIPHESSWGDPWSYSQLWLKNDWRLWHEGRFQPHKLARLQDWAYAVAGETSQRIMRARFLESRSLAEGRRRPFTASRWWHNGCA